MDIDFINSYRQILSSFLDENRSLRRELVNYLSSLGEIWKKLPKDIPNEEKILLIERITQEFINELEYSSQEMDQQYKIVLNNEHGMMLSKWDILKQEIESKNNDILRLEEETTNKILQLTTENKEYSALITSLSNTLKNISDLVEKYDNKRGIFSKEKIPVDEIKRLL